MARKAGGGDGLVGTLAAAAGVEGVGEEGFARCGDAGSSRDEVHV